MILSRDQTSELFNLVLSLPLETVRGALHNKLRAIHRTEPEFYASVIKYAQNFNFNSDQWFDFLSKIPNRVFRDEMNIMRMLSENQLTRLPPTIFNGPTS